MMTKPSHKVLLFSSSLILASCALLPAKTSDKVDQLIQENAYDEAISLYERLPAEEKTKVDIGKIQTARLKYEQKLLYSISKQIQQHQFIDADKSLQQAYDTIPSSDSLQKLSDELASKKAQYTYQHELTHNTIWAAFLIEEQPLLEKIYQAKYDDKTFMRLYQQRQQERVELAETLGVSGLAALEKKHYSKSKEFLTLAQSLHEDPRWQAGLKTINSHEQNLREQSRKAAKKKQQEQLQRLQEDFNTAIASGDYTTAKQQLTKLQKQEGLDAAWLKQAEQQLNQKIQANLDSALKRGRMLYSQGKIAEALQVWKQVQVYVQDNRELNDNIERAERFLQRYQELKK